MIQRKNCTMILDPESQGSVFFSSKNTTSFVSTSFKSSTALASAVSMHFYYLLELQHKLDQWVEFFAGPKKYG